MWVGSVRDERRLSVFASRTGSLDVGCGEVVVEPRTVTKILFSSPSSSSSTSIASVGFPPLGFANGGSPAPMGMECMISTESRRYASKAAGDNLVYRGAVRACRWARRWSLLAIESLTREGENGPARDGVGSKRCNEKKGMRADSMVSAGNGMRARMCGIERMEETNSARIRGDWGDEEGRDWRGAVAILMSDARALDCFGAARADVR